MVSNTIFGERVLRNPFRARKRSGRSRTNAVESMTPQGQALWASKNVDNASGFIGPVFKKVDRKYTMEEANEILHALDGKVIDGALIKGNMIYFQD